MKRTASVLLVLFALLLVACDGIDLPPGEYVVIPAGDQMVTPGVYRYAGPDGEYVAYLWPQLPTGTPVATATPDETEPPEPTEPPSPTPTLTPSPTPTATETATATATWTLTPAPTATPSSVPVTPVQSPSSTPVPSPTQETGTPSCAATVTATSSVNIRADHSTTAAVLGKLAPGDQLIVYETWSELKTSQGTYYDWVRFRRVSDGLTGWAAFLYTQTGANVQTQTWITWDREHCGLPHGGPGVDDNIATKTAWGVLTTVGADKATVQKMIDIVAGAGREPALTVVMDASMAAAFDDRAYVIWRAWPDCPAMLDDVAASVQARLDYIDQVTRHDSFDALQLSNECLWPSPGYLNAWTLAALDQARARWPGKAIIPWVWAPGTFKLDWLPVIRPALVEMRKHGDLFGLNLYPARAGVPLSTRDLWTIWTTWRYEMIRALMEPGADPCFAVTEAGAGDGNMALTPGDAGAFAAGIDGDVCVATLWHLSPADPPGPWPDANLLDRVRVVFEAVSQALE